MMQTRWRDGEPPTHADLEAIFTDLTPHKMEAYQRAENLRIHQVYVGTIPTGEPGQTPPPHVAAFAVVWDEPANPGAIHASTVMQVAYQDTFHQRGEILETYHVPRVLHPGEAQLIGGIISTNAVPTLAGPEWIPVDSETEGGLS